MATNETEKLQETIDELKERVERLEKENAKLKGEMKWAPRPGDDYFVVDGGRTWCYTNSDPEEGINAIAAGNCFKTRDEAKEFLEWLKARKTLLDDTKDFKPDWKDANMDKFCATYDPICATFNVDIWRTTNQGQNIWFETREDAEESIKKHKNEWRIYMGLPAKKDSDDE